MEFPHNDRNTIVCVCVCVCRGVNALIIFEGAQEVGWGYSRLFYLIALFLGYSEYSQ